MNIKKFPPVGTTPTENSSASELTKPTATQNSKGGPITKDEFERAKKATIDELVSKQDPQNMKAKQLLSMKQHLEPAADCEPMTRVELAGICIAAKKLQPVADGDSATRAELAGSCIPMKKLEPVGDCEPGTRIELAGNCITFKNLPGAESDAMTRLIDKLRQQHPIIIEKKIAKPEE